MGDNVDKSVYNLILRLFEVHFFHHFGGYLLKAFLFFVGSWRESPDFCEKLQKARFSQARTVRIKKEFRARNSRAVRGRLCRHISLPAHLRIPAERFYFIGNLLKFPIK